MLGTGWAPKRLAHAAPSALPDIQFDFGDYIAPIALAETINDVDFRFGSVFTSFLTTRLARTPTLDDQEAFAEALDTIEDRYEFSPAGVFSIVSYGIPYSGAELAARGNVEAHRSGCPPSHRLDPFQSPFIGRRAGSWTTSQPDRRLGAARPTRFDEL